MRFCVSYALTVKETSFIVCIIYVEVDLQSCTTNSASSYFSIPCSGLILIAMAAVGSVLFYILFFFKQKGKYR